jgi:hypothetical protein
VAVLCVESGGRGFSNGRMVIRFENHIFWDQWGKQHPAEFGDRFRYDPAKRWTGHSFRADAAQPWQPSHPRTNQQDAEWQALAIARTLHEHAALRSISMGSAQIMGFNHARIGYDSVAAMFDAFCDDERAHIIGMFDFIRGPGASSPMLDALRREQYQQFATGYNGSGQAAIYGDRIRAHAEAFDALRQG